MNFLNNIEIDSFVENIAEESLVEKQVGLHKVEIDYKCSHTTKRCFRVVDQLIEDHSTYRVERTLNVDGFEDESDSIAVLKGKKGERFDESDTRMWEVDHSLFTAQYLATIFVAPFAFTTLSLDDESEQKRFLEIGLGGGSFDMFLRIHKSKVNITTIELEPLVVELAHKWFNLVEDSYRRTIIGDGVEYIKSAVGKGEKYDGFLLDACDTSKILPCPAGSFLNAELVASIHKLLNPRGIAVINILPLDGSEEHVRSVAKLFTGSFPSCATMHISAEVNVILVCLPYSISDPAQQLRFLENRIQAVIRHFKLEYILDNVVLSALY